MEKKIKVGILGLRMGAQWAAGAKNLPGAELSVIYDKDEKLKAEKAGVYNVTPAKSEDDFFESDLDIAVIATPDHLHVEQSIRALDRRMHVACEKPLALTVKECKKIIAKVEALDRFFMIGQVCRHAPAFRLAKSIVESGEIGEISFIESEYAHDYSRSPGRDNWRKAPEIKREGLIGGGCHALDLIRWIAGNPVEVFCYSNKKFLTDWPTNDTAVAIFKFPDKVIGKVFVSTGIKSKYTMRTVIYGTKGTVICDNTSPELQLYKTKYSEASKSQDFCKIPVKVDNHNVTSELEEFIEYIKRDEQCPTDVYEGTRTVAFGEAALISSQTGAPVKIGDIYQ